VISSYIGVSFLLEVLAGFSTRHDTPPPQTASPRFAYSSVLAGAALHRSGHSNPSFARLVLLALAIFGLQALLLTGIAMLLGVLV